MTIDRLHVCHLGAIGHIPSSDDVSAIGDVDVLLLPVGGGGSFSPSQASETVSLFEPKVVIPMCYKTEAISQPIEPVEMFLKEFGVKDVQPLPKLFTLASSMLSVTKVSRHGLPPVEEPFYPLLWVGGHQAEGRPPCGGRPSLMIACFSEAIRADLAWPS